MASNNPQNIQPGDFIVGYHRGVHIVERLEPCTWSPNRLVVIYRQVMSAEFDEPAARRGWDRLVDYVTKVDKVWVDKLEQEYADRIARLRKLLAGQWATANSIKIKRVP